ncbi:hypothetical protein ZWY2020_009728 [Hordeum vulgare]|nr:hypothetical protein ZWY2020_009728 [Hordeum vulgare]
MRSGPRRRTRTGRTSDSGAVGVDRLSTLPDVLLHHIMSFRKLWEVVPTCLLAHRWRHLWASAPCVDLRVSHFGREDDRRPEDLCDVVDSLFLHRDVSAPMDTLRLRSSDEYAGFGEKDANRWIRAAFSRNVRVIHLAGHRKGLALLERVHFVSCHLKILKLAHAKLEDSNFLLVANPWKNWI